MRTINRFFFPFLAVMAFSCDDILEEDITDDMVQIASPMNNSIIESNVVNFRWNTIGGADKYRIQVYGNNQSMVVDTLVNPSSFAYPMRGGEYSWRIRGENSAYQSSYSFPSNFKVIESDDLGNQQMILVRPLSASYLNTADIVCIWETLNVAESYEFELINQSTGTTYSKLDIASNSFTLPVTELALDAKYTWKVRARNASSVTLYSSRDFWIDRVRPNQPQNILPANNLRASANSQIDFSWTMPPDSGEVQSPIRSYTIEIARDSNFSSSQISNTANPSFQQIFTETGDYFWRIKATDAANNTSTYSGAYKFTLN